MQLLTAEILDHAPPLYANEHLKPEEIEIVAKFFDPSGSFRWYMTEYDPADQLAFGFTTSHLCPEGELGYFSMSELQSITGPLGLGIERDLYFGKHTLAEVMAGTVV